MITAGIIAEYNPFHSGHKYHIEETRRRTGADYIIAVLSGDFVQRGEPAVVDKYFRTRMALAGGADLVLELPAVYATASAEYFAMAGVSLLHALQCVDYLSFGSEWVNREEYDFCVKVLTQEPKNYQILLKEGLKKGKNFPSARQEAMEKIAGKNIELLRYPNHILGLEYGKAIQRLHSSIQPVAIQRRGAGYHDREERMFLASATAVREKLKKCREEVGAHGFSARRKAGDVPEFFTQIPGNLGEELFAEYMSGNTVSWEDMMPLLDYTIVMQRENLADFFGIDEEMAARIRKNYIPGQDFSALIETMHTKNLTDAAWRRGFLHLLLQMKKEPYLRQAAKINVPYARVLGFSSQAAPLLRMLRKNSTIPIIQKPAQGKKQLEQDPAACALYGLDIRSAEIYEQIAAAKAGRRPIAEWARPQIRLDNF